MPIGMFRCTQSHRQRSPADTIVRLPQAETHRVQEGLKGPARPATDAGEEYRLLE